MAIERTAGQLQVFRRRKPVFWQRWNVTPYPDQPEQAPKVKSRQVSLPVRLDRMLDNRLERLPEPAAIGENGDPYPLIERKRRITHRCLEVLAKHGCPIIVSTGSSLILRDIDLIRELHEESMATVCLKLPIKLFSRDRVHSREQSRAGLLALLERICRSGVQTGIIIESTEGQPFLRRRLEPFFKIAALLSVDFIHFPVLRIPRGSYRICSRSMEENSDGSTASSFREKSGRVGLKIKKSILQLSQDYNIRLNPKRFLPKDKRLENFWLAETLANRAYFLEMSGAAATNYWAAARRIDNFDGDVRLWALRGELAPMTSHNPVVRADVERLLRGERDIHL